MKPSSEMSARIFRLSSSDAPPGEVLLRTSLAFPILALTLLLIVVGDSARADQVFLSNGDRLTGKTTIQGAAVHVVSPVAGQVRLPRSAITRILLDAPTAMQVQGRSMRIRSMSFAPGYVSLEADDGEVVSVASELVEPTLVGRATSVQRRRPAWTTSLDVGLTAARGNTQLNNFRMGIQAAQVGRAHRLELGFTLLIAETGSAASRVTTADSVHGSARYEVNFGKRSYAFGLASYDFDGRQRLDLRSVYGGGIGVRGVRASKATLDLFSGATYNGEQYSTRPGRKSAELLAGQEFTYRLSSGTSLNQRFVVFPNLTSLGNYRADLDSAVQIRLNRWMGWRVGLTDRYLTNPLLQARNNDLVITSGIRFTFGSERVFNPQAKVGP
jgi:putative salt-induced outer membrane protein YdiY